MRILYTIGIFCYYLVIKCASFFHKKAKLWIKGRDECFRIIKQHITANDRVLWFHAASLGEFEQGLPVIEAMQLKNPSHQIVVSFFSPSGYVVIKDKNYPYVITYLPIDTISNMRKWVKILRPEKVFFIKYEYWYNAMAVLHQENVPFYYISSIFRENQIFFKFYGSWFRKHLKYANHFFVQNEQSKNLLSSINIPQVSISGDTRFDRVKKIAIRDNSISWLQNFSNQKKLVVAGSTWEKDEDLWINYINKNQNENVKFLIIPHNIHKKSIELLRTKIPKSLLYTAINDLSDLSDFSTIIVNTVGILTRIYAYANLVYVGGGFGKEGVHNVLEPAVFGKPIIIGPIYHQFEEAKSLVKEQGIVVTKNYSSLEHTVNELLQNEKLALQKGNINKNFILNTPNAVEVITQNLF